MTRKRILAWLALILFILIIVNILFIHVYVTESVVVFCLYVLIFYFGMKRDDSRPPDDTGSEGVDLQEDGESSRQQNIPGDSEKKG